MVSPESILAHVEEVFLKKLVSAMNREIKIIKQRRCPESNYTVKW